MDNTSKANSAEEQGQVHLTSMCRCAGCAAKIRAKDIEEVLRGLALPHDDRVLAGHQSADDAVVVQVREDLALVQTVDFFPPVVDDPRSFGRIAAANSLSDVYAMGGTPLSAMNITCFPTKKYGTAVLGEILQGGLEKVLEAGAVLAGGHTVEDNEPKFGLAVTGAINPKRIVTKGGARPGDALVLTKPLGTGVLNTAHKAGDIEPRHLERLISNMETLNAGASRAMVKLGVKGATDVTGYSLLGHSLEMCRASAVDFELRVSWIPLLPGVRAAFENGYYSDGSYANLQYVRPFTSIADDVPEYWEYLLADAQTSGGLLIAVPQDRLEEMLAEMDGERVAARLIGRVLEPAGGEQRLRIVK